MTQTETKPLPTRYQHNKAFQQALQQLNPTQRKAVEQMDGPVMVIAGPGTGKTQVLAARIGSILLNTDTNPYELLCLTYSDAGVVAMQQRLLTWIGPEAHRISIFTFHSFARKVIRENPLAFGGVAIEVIDEIERSEVIRSILDKLPPEHPLTAKANSQYFYERHLTQLFKLIKQENWIPKTLVKDIDAYLLALPQDPDYLYKRGKQKGQLKEAVHYQEVNRMKLLRAGVLLFSQYNTALQKIDRYDFEDMIRWVVTAFQQKPYILRRYQEQFLYFLVDEYQDTNGVQNELLQLLISYWDNPNIFVVGDDDQSVFEFQGARIKNISDFYQKYKNSIQLFVLEDNYRCQVGILQAAGELIKHNQIRLIHQEEIEASKDLRASARGLLSFEKPIEILALDNYVQELAAILHAIKFGQDAKIPLHEMAIIYRNHKTGDDITKLLETNQIDYELKKSINLLEESLIKQILLILHYTVRERTIPKSGSKLVFELLSIPAFGVEDSDIIRLNYHRANNDLTWYSILHDVTLLESLALINVKKINNFAQIMDQIIVSSSHLSMTEWLESTINISGLLPFALAQADKQWNLDLLFSFRKFIKTQVLKKSDLSIQELLMYIQRMQDNRVIIPIMKIQGRSKGIKLLSAHSSKGLEFRLVIMPACTTDWEKRWASKSAFKIPSNITMSGEENQLESERRLFYVSMTRAKEKLFLLYPITNNKKKGTKPSQFITELNLPTQKWQANPTSITHIEQSVLQLHVTPMVEIQKDVVGKVLEQFVLSISSLNSFLKCPVSFYYDYILQVPSETGAAALYGTAFHGALRKMVEQMRLSSDKKYPTAEMVSDYFELEMKRIQGLFVQTEYESRLLRGKAAIQDYYRQHHQDWIQDTIAEYHITHTEIDGVPVKGNLDRLDFVDGQTAHVLDYKTGEPIPVYAPKKDKPDGSDYWRQLVFYALLFEHQRADSRRVIKGTISFIERNSKNQFIDKTFEIEREDKMLVRETLKTTWTKIQNSEFYNGCNKPKCKWCTFQKTQKAPASFRDEVILNLDD